MNNRRKISRRSFLGQVVGGAVGLGAMSMIGADPAEAAQNCSDSDTGSYGDGIGRGRNCAARRPRTNVSDTDSGPNQDAPNYGVRGGCSDSDTGRRADPRGRGRRCGGGGGGQTGVTDQDSGPNRDQPLYGRGRARSRNCSDSDSGQGSDPIGRGRRC